MSKMFVVLDDYGNLSGAFADHEVEIAVIDTRIDFLDENMVDRMTIYQEPEEVCVSIANAVVDCEKVNKVFAQIDKYVILGEASG